MKTLSKILHLLLLTIISTHTTSTAAQNIKLGIDSVAPLTIHVGKGSLTLFGYGQSTYTLSETAGETRNAFAISRVMLMADIHVTKKLSCFLMGDFASGKMHEYYAQYDFCPAFKVRVGQFKQPFTIESPMSPALNGNINGHESVLYMAGIASDSCFGVGRVGRDAGIMLTGDLIPYQGRNLLNYSLGVFNGAGMNVRENNKYKDVIGTLKVFPLKQLMLSTSFIVGKAKAQSNSPYGKFMAGDNYTRNRWSAGCEVTTRPLHLRSEFLLGNDAGIHSNGFYALVEGHLAKWLDLVAGYDHLKRNNDIAQSATSNYLAGLQFWIYKKCCIRSQYVHKAPKQGPTTNMWVTQFQVGF